MREFDVVVIGAGPAGVVAAGRLGQAGLSVAIVESHLIGGECSYYGCMPSKALLRPGEALAEAQRIPGAREASMGELDVEAVLSRRDEIIHDLDDSVQVPWLEESNVTIVRGFGRFAGERRVEVGDELLVARRAVIVAVGTGPVLPPIPGLAEAVPWTNRDATTAKAAPEHLLVLGRGVVGIVREEAFASDEVTTALQLRGVDVRTGVAAIAVERKDDHVVVELENGDRLRGDELLVAVGRRPPTEDLGLETVGLDPGGYLSVDDGMRVYGRNAPGTARLVVDLEREVIVGATFTGPDVAEFLHAATVAIVAAVPISRLRHAVPAFPTRSEVWLRPLDKYEIERRTIDEKALVAVAV